MDSDVVAGEVGCLCAEYERIAFTDGLKLGAQLMLELAENTTGKQSCLIKANVLCQDLHYVV